MRTMMVCVLSTVALMLAACGDPNPVPYITDSDTFAEKDIIPPTEQDGLPEADVPVPEGNDPDATDDGQPTPDDDVAPVNCKLDSDCGAPDICVKAKCAKGCSSNADCANYPNTTCNTKLGRCLNTTASNGACNETNCPGGCCYADKGFLGLKCATTGTLSVCGICAQGEVYMNGSQCVPAACKVGETKCQTYNSYSQRSECFECAAEKQYLCQDDVQCSGGSALMMVNVMECVPAGERCSARDTCCSGMPCIQGYCY